MDTFGPLCLREGVLANYRDVLSPAALETMSVLAPLEGRRRALMRSRIERRARRQRERERITFLPADATIGGTAITPVAPHNLNVRPIVVPDNNIISFEVEGRAENFICVLDSRKEIVDKQVQLAVRNEAFTLSLIRLNENNFLQTLRGKLSWGLDTRN